jgi:hypothetical protein
MAFIGTISRFLAPPSQKNSFCQAKLKITGALRLPKQLFTPWLTA